MEIKSCCSVEFSTKELANKRISLMKKDSSYIKPFIIQKTINKKYVIKFNKAL